MAQSRLVGLTPGAAFLPPVLRAAVLEVSMAQIPRLSTCPHCHADGNPYSQGLQLLPSLREDLAFLVPPGRQRRSAQGTRSGATPICPGKLGETL